MLITRIIVSLYILWRLGAQPERVKTYKSSTPSGGRRNIRIGPFEEYLQQLKLDEVVTLLRRAVFCGGKYSKRIFSSLWGDEKLCVPLTKNDTSE